MAALRGLVEALEALQVDNARAKGWSCQDIAAGWGSPSRPSTRSTARAPGRAHGLTLDQLRAAVLAELDRSEG